MSEFIKAWQVPNFKTVYEDKNGNLTVREGGEADWRNKNPGNIRYTDETVASGAIGSMKLHPETDFDSMAIFPDRETALKAKSSLINKYYLDLSLDEAIRKYSPPSDNRGISIPDKIKHIAQSLGVSSDTIIRTLGPERIEKFKSELKKYEGKENPGEEYSFAVGTPENQNLRKQKILHYHYARRLPLEELEKDEDYNALFRSNDAWKDLPYRMSVEERRLWQKRKKNMEALIQKASQKKTGRSSKSGGTVHVRAHTREGGKEQVKAYERSKPEAHKEGH